MCFQSTTKTEVNTPAQTPAEAKLEGLAANYAGDYAYPAAQNLSTKATAGLNNAITPDYASLYPALQTGVANQQNQFGNLQTYANQGYEDLASGKTPAALQAARYSYMNEPMQQANVETGKALNQMGQRGILNSRVTSDALTGIGNTMNNTIANKLSDAYTTDYGLGASTLNSNISNKSNLINLGMDTAYAPIQYAASAQGASSATPLQWFNSATGQAQVGSDAWNQMANRRYGASGTTTTAPDNSFLNAIAGVAGAYAGRKT